MPLTPQTAALGPAAQATVPTPQSAIFPPQPFNKVFNGNFFERADTYLAMSGSSSALSSRTATMNSSFGSTDSFMAPSLVSPAGLMGSSRLKDAAGRDLGGAKALAQRGMDV